jgi:hypothetical protein
VRSSVDRSRWMVNSIQVIFLVLLDVHKLSSEYFNRFSLSLSEVSNAVG